MSNVIINGAFGKMGQATQHALANCEDLNVVASLGREDKLSASISETNADIVIDFTDAASAFKNTQLIIEAGAKPIIGTSGLTAEQIVSLQQQARAKQLGGVIAPNFSLGAVLLMRYAQDAAKYLHDVEIIEMHHEKKLDAPSGTAMKTAAMIAEVATPNQHADCVEVLPGSRGANANNIPVHALRLPGLLAHQQVIFGNRGETLTLKHDSISRECFMPGVILACRKVTQLDELIYGLENILD